jgi:hypothetical protein
MLMVKRSNEEQGLYKAIGLAERKFNEGLRERIRKAESKKTNAILLLYIAKGRHSVVET